MMGKERSYPLCKGIWTKYRYILPKLFMVFIIAGVFTLLVYIREERSEYIATPFVRPWIPYIPMLTTCYHINDPLNATIMQPKSADGNQITSSSSLIRVSRPFISEFKNPCYLLRDENSIFGEVLAKSEATRDLTRQGLATIPYMDYKSHDTSTGTLRCLPYYFVLGFAKCGTTDMFEKMMAHPYILRHEKEPMWFNTKRFKKNNDSSTLSAYVDSFDRTTSRPIASYFQRYGTRVPLIVGDHSTHTIDAWKGYSYGIAYNSTAPKKPSHNALQRYSNPALIKTLIPDTKFIIVMREPVSRIFSLYKFHDAHSLQDFHNGVVNGISWWTACLKENYSPIRCLLDRPEVKTYKAVTPCLWETRALSSLRRGIYHLFIKEWLDIFPREQFLILKFEDYASNSSHVLNNEVYPFLGLPKLSGFNEMSMNIRFGFRIDSFRFKKKQRSKGSGNWELKYTGWSQGDMWAETRNLLTDFYAEHKLKLAELLNDEKFLWQKK